jgi:DNA-binding transcriptional regulator YiaG
LTYGGRLIGTVPQAAARHGITPNAMHKALARAPEVRPVVDSEGRPVVSAREPVYYLSEIDTMMGGRPGKGANLRGRGRPSGWRAPACALRVRSMHSRPGSGRCAAAQAATLADHMTEPRSAVGVPSSAGLGDRIRAARTARGMSRENVAALCGRSEQWLRQLERGKRGTGLFDALMVTPLHALPWSSVHFGQWHTPNAAPTGAAATVAIRRSHYQRRMTIEFGV